MNGMMFAFLSFRFDRRAQMIDRQMLRCVFVFESTAHQLRAESIYSSYEYMNAMFASIK